MGKNCSKALGCAREQAPTQTKTISTPYSPQESGYQKVAGSDNTALMETRRNEPPKKRSGGHCKSCIMLLVGIALIGAGCGMNADAMGLIYKWFIDGMFGSEEPMKTSCDVINHGVELGVEVDGACDSYMKYFSPDKRTASELTTRCQGEWRQVPGGISLSVEKPPTQLAKTKQVARLLLGEKPPCYQIPWALVSLSKTSTPTQECAYANGWGNGAFDESKFPTAPAPGNVMDCYVWKGAISLTSDTVGGFPIPDPFIGAMEPVSLLKAFLIPLGFVVSLLSCFMCCCGC